MTAGLQTSGIIGAGGSPFVDRIRLRARRRALWMRALWAADTGAATQGFAISHAEVDRILADPERIATAEIAFSNSDDTACQLDTLIEIADRAAEGDEVWNRLRSEFGLNAAEIDLLSMAVAIEVEPMLGRVYGYLHDNANALHPTPWLAADLFRWRGAIGFTPESALMRWHLARPLEAGGNPWSVTAPWIADTQVTNWLLRRDWRDPALGRAVTMVPASAEPDGVRLYSEQVDSMLNFVAALEGPANGKEHRLPAPIEIELIAAAGSGRRTMAKQFCSQLGANLLIADGGVLLGRDTPAAIAAERVVRAVRMARMIGAVLYWHDADAADPAVWHEAPAAAITILGTQKPLPHSLRRAPARKSLKLPPLTRAQRAVLWERLAEGQPPAPILDWALAPAEIAAAAAVAPAGPQAVAEACRRILYQAPGELFMPLPCPYTWDDIVLADHVREHLAELEAQARLRGPVYEDWGFGRLCPLGKGISALFAGPSGTGKTMAAQVIARSLGMELYRVDLSGVVNKYIGETEKRLKQVFDACERANVVLFFDEADALFGQRTQVKDAHDRFANIEIDYLLQRMEQFDGIAILATNRKSDLDQAFLRRLRFIIDFLPPGPAERRRLWELALMPAGRGSEPILDGIDFEFLAARLDMTGADIKAAALAAAFVARSSGIRITMDHVLHGARREMTKHGITVRPGDWMEAAHG
jgi:ATPase family associated with various cellular activities (AAA)/Winged helix domain, variant